MCGIKRTSALFLSAAFFGNFICSAQAETPEVFSKLEAYKNVPYMQEKAPKLPLPSHIKVVGSLAFGGHFYVDENNSFPDEPNLELTSPYHGRKVEYNSKNDLSFLLKPGGDKITCQKKLPYLLSVDGLIHIGEKIFAQHTKCLPSIGLLWFDNGQSVSIGSDKDSCYFAAPKAIPPDYHTEEVPNQGDYFFGGLDDYEDSKGSTTESDLEESLKTREIWHKTALLFQHHLPIAVSYGDYAIALTFPDKTPLREFQKRLNDPEILKERVEHEQQEQESGICG